MSNKTYDILKWIALIFLPALAVFYGAVGPVWGWFEPDKIVFTLTAVDTFLGALLGISSISYANNANQEAPAPDQQEEQKEEAEE